MTILWSEFVLVVVASLIAACLVVAAYSLALRVRDGEEPWRRVASISLFGLCGLFVAAGIFFIVPALHSAVLG